MGIFRHAARSLTVAAMAGAIMTLGPFGPASATNVVVTPGDSVSRIAKRYHVPWHTLAQANGITGPRYLIRSGAQLRIPTAAKAPAQPQAKAPAPAVRQPAGKASSAKTSGTTKAGKDTLVNPFKVGRWAPGRTDQGVDWYPLAPSPVVAIGSGVVTYSSTRSGWPGGAFVSYRLSSGTHAGRNVFVAEHLTGIPGVGTVVRPGQTIATALPGYPWTEWGWAAPQGPHPAVRYNGARDGTPMPGGKAFARLLISLGAHPLQDPGPGPDYPAGN